MVSRIHAKRTTRPHRPQRRLGFEPVEPRLMLSHGGPHGGGGGGGGNAEYAVINFELPAGIDGALPLALNDAEQVEVVGLTYSKSGSDTIGGPGFYWSPSTGTVEIPLVAPATGAAGVGVNAQGHVLVPMNGSTYVWRHTWTTPVDLGIGGRYPEINDTGIVRVDDWVIVPEDNLDGTGNPGSDGIPDTWYRDDDADGENDLAYFLSGARDINVQGDVAGSSSGRAAIWTQKPDGTYDAAPDFVLGPEYDGSIFFQINAIGQAAGHWIDPSNGEYHLIFWDGTSLHDGGKPDGADGTPSVSGLNDNGIITGSFHHSDGKSHVYYWSPEMDSPEDIGSLGPGNTTFLDLGKLIADPINNAGTIVGMSQQRVKHGVLGGTPGDWHAFVFDPIQGIRDLNDLTSTGGLDIVRSRGINNRGHIIADGRGRGVLLVPLGDPLATAASSQLNTTSAAAVDAALLAWIEPDASDDDDADLLAGSVADDLAMMLVE